jgi:tetratricopeptide (TPR) repeat protein
MEADTTIHLPYLLAALWRTNFTGKLTLLEGAVERVLFLVQGRVVHVQSRLQEETLGRILLDEGKLTKAQYDQLLERMLQAKRPAGELLIQLGFLGPQEVFGALEFQTRRKLSNSFRMNSYGFQIEAEAVPIHLQLAHLEIPEAIFAGLHAHYSADRLMDEFRVDEETVFTVRPPRPEQPVPLGPKESRLLRTVAAGTALARLMAKGVDLHQLLSMLYGMHALWLLEASGVDRPALDDLGLVGLEPEAPDPDQPIEVEVSVDGEEDLGLDGQVRAPTLVTILEGRIDPKLAEKILSLVRVDHFGLLGVGRQASKPEVRAAYERLVKVFKLNDIDQAYESPKERELAHRLLDQATLAFRELGDETSRAAYLADCAAQRDPERREVPPRVLADVQAQKGLLAITARRWAEAQALFQEAIRLYPQEPSYHCLLGRVGYLGALEKVAAQDKLPENLRAPFLAALGLDPHYDEPRLYLGYIAKRNGELHRALKEFQAALECNPQNRLAQSEARLLQRRLQPGGSKAG